MGERWTGAAERVRASQLASDALVRDLQSLLAEAVRGLRDVTGLESAVAWALRESGQPYVAAASFVGPPPLAPDPASFALAAALGAATDLTRRRLPEELRALARAHRCAALAPVQASGGRVLAVLCLGPAPPAAADRGRIRVGGGLEPVVLGALDAAAARLQGPLSAALALGRLRQVDTDVCRLDRLAALGSLTAEIAHEIRNPLVSVKTFLQLVRQRACEPESLEQFAAVVGDELRRMERLLDSLIAHGAPAETAEGPAALTAVLNSLAELVRQRARAGGVELEVGVPLRLPTVAIGEDRLRQVVLNLALNAIDATPAGGTVRLRGRAAGGAVELLVSDEGPGIAEELRDAVFEPFFSARRDRPGGLGLAITRRIVTEAGGEIAVSAGAGGGAEFRVRLPATRVAASFAPATPPLRD